MSWINRITNLLRSRELAKGLDEELRFHLDSRIRDNIKAGMTPEEARRDSARRFGNQTLQIPGIPSDSHGFPQLSFSSLYPSLGNANNNGTDPQYFQNWTGVDDVSWVKGAPEKAGDRPVNETIAAFIPKAAARDLSSPGTS